MNATDLWIATPLLILAGSAILVLLAGAVRRDWTGTRGGVAAALGAALWEVQVPPANLAPTLGLAATPLARLFTSLFCLTAAAVLLLSRTHNQRRGIGGAEYTATLLFTAFGMAALAAATSLLTLFLGLEAMTFGFYILVAIDLKREASGEAGLKYLLMGAIAAAFLAFGIAFLYAGTGSLAIADLLRLAAGNRIAMAGCGFLLVGIAFKLSLVPAHLWTPDVYQGAPAPVAAFLAAASKGATVVALLLILPAGNAAILRVPLWGLAFLSMIVGNLAALLQTRVRRMLAYSSMAQMGYVVLALMSGSGGGYRAAAFYAVAYAAMSLAAFGAIVLLEQDQERETVEDYQGLGFRRPFTAGVLALSLFALAGIPPTAGFTGKFLIFAAALNAGEIPLAIVGILTAAVSAYYYLRVVVSLYCHPAPRAGAAPPTWTEIAVLAVAAGAILWLGLFPAPLLAFLRSVV
jgi:NADH-quinone oxidoreductase subunit N